MDYWFALASAYARAHSSLGIGGRVRGLGRLLRRTHQERLLKCNGSLFFYDPHIAGCYDSIVGGRICEPETHRFFNALLGNAGKDVRVHYLDVGANIGELLIEVGKHARVVAATAFEPQVRCARACGMNVRLNELDGKVQVRSSALSSSRRMVRFGINAVAPQASGIVAGAVSDSSGDASSMAIETSTLDEEICHDADVAYLVKIDVEGAELDVVRGAERLVREHQPLIVFEYNGMTRRHFTLDEFRLALGPAYRIFRLRHDGRLDGDLTETWNCVAVADTGPLAAAAQKLIDET